MMKTVISIIVALMILAGLSACQNNGNIGDRYGLWKLTDILIDGVNDADYQGNVFWAFQTGVIEMKGIHGDECIVSFGRCTEEGDKMILDFKNHDSSHPEGSQYYSPLPETYLPSNTVVTLSILKLDGSQMKLLYHGADDKAYIYILKKWG